MIGEAPGREEDKAGLPFVGPSGTFLKRSLRKAGLRQTDGAYMNAVSCFPGKQKTPTLDQVSECRRNVFSQLDVFARLPVLTVGSIALHTLMPNAELSWAMGGPIEDIHGHTIFPVYHPSYILRTQSREIRSLWYRHLDTFADLVNGAHITRDTLQIGNCLYCGAGRMRPGPTCIRHERLLAKDRVRKVKKDVHPQLGLFDEPTLS